jgi:uncharacterized protein YndB with AHSA1/START domain
MTPATSAEPSIVVTRVFDAPRETVFKLWTDPRHVARWWGPIGFSTTISEMDVRPGGTWRFVMRGPDGTRYVNRVSFIEVAEPERLVYKHGSEPVDCEVTVTFAERGGKTEITMRMLFPSAEARDHAVEKVHAIEGGNQMLARLAERLAAEKLDKEVVITRIFDASREVVFKAWIDPEQLRHWWGPKGFTNPVCEVDARASGAIRIDMRAPDGVVYPMTGVFLEVVEPERLVFTSAALDKEGNPLFENLNTVIFEEYGAGTKLTLHSRVALTTAEGAPYLAGMDEGWKMTIDRLGEHLKV